jgi:hypothetical protein
MFVRIPGVGISPCTELAAEIIVRLEQRDVEPLLQQAMRCRKSGKTRAGDYHLWHVGLASSSIVCRPVYHERTGIERKNAMMTDYRTMLFGMAALQAAGATAAVAIAVRYLEFALREGELVTRILLAGPPAAQGGGRSWQERPILRLAECYTGCVRGFAALPRVSALILLGELDRIRGPRAAPGNAGAGATDSISP